MKELSLHLRERRVLQLRYGLLDDRCRKREEVGRIFGVTDERIGEIETKALIKIGLAHLEDVGRE